MKRDYSRKIILAMIVAVGLSTTMLSAGRAEVTDLADVPLANSPSDTVLPNLMYILDDSGSMMWDYMPDNVQRLTNSTIINNCKSCGSSTCSIAAVQCALGNPGSTDGNTADFADPPYYSAQFNQIYYNPNITYAPGVTAAGITMGNQSPTAAVNDAYLDSTPRDLTTTYPEVYYCNTNSPTTANLSDITKCKRNGINNVQSTPANLNYFLYWTNITTLGTPLGAYPVQTGTSSTTFRYQIVMNTGHPYYFTIAPHEYCSDKNLMNCALAQANGSAPSGYSIPAPLRYCGATADAASTSVVSDTVGTATPKCQKKFDVNNYPYPRDGRFTRVDIVPGTATYTKSPNSVRTDCASTTVCTYSEELQNFANWYSYYRVRMTMMKTATGRAFLPIDDRFRVGFITINPGSPVQSSRYLPINTFNSGQKSSFYTELYAQTNHGSTPLRKALSRVGRHYAGVTSGINDGMPQDPIQYSCQQNFSLLTTDGYWNDSDTDAVTTSGAQVGNQDNVPDTVAPIFVSRASGTLDGLGTQFTNVTPSTITEQVVCSGNSTTTFSTGSQTSCGCSTSPQLSRVKQRTITQTTTTIGTDGVQSSSNTTSSATFQNVTACNALVVTQSTTPDNFVEAKVCQRGTTPGNQVTFSNGGGPISCGSCAGTRKVLIKDTITGATQTVTTTDGVTTSNTITGGTNAFKYSTDGTTFLSAFPGTCATSGTSLSGSGLTVTSTGATTPPTSNGGTTITSAMFTVSPNPTVTAGSATATNVPGGTANTLADVSMYYYKTDLRTTGTVAPNNVPTTAKDFTPTQHMTTFTLGLGLQGQLDYTPDYESNPASDFAKIKSAATTCAWTTGTCNWPAPVSSTPTTLDDLWHAAVNGRGLYYSASDPNTLADGLSGALSALKIQTAAASASATSSPNITQTDNFIYSTTFRTVKWDGEIVAQQIDPTTGNVLAPIVWSAQALLDSQVFVSSDTRAIWKFDSTQSSKLNSFIWGNLTGAEQAFFANTCTGLSQCPLLTAAQQVSTNNGQNMVNFLRGQTGNQSTLYRIRDHALGDPVNATPTFVRQPRFGFADAVTPTYATFATANASRQGVLYVGANDGMLHAFNGTTGQEMWAYSPRIVFPNLYKLASDNWDVGHKYSVDGSPQIMDVFDSTAGAWKTILVAGLNNGGRGYYALDITNPSSPKGLWEICSDSTLCAISDSDVGSTYGFPVITKRAFDGKWVVLVTSGYDNVSPGTGHGILYVLDALTGAILRKVDTNTGNTTTPSGLAKISAFANNFNVDNTTTFVYGGDLLGNVWRFDMSVDPPALFNLAVLTDATNKPQSITTRPELAVIKGARVVYVGTGRYLGTSDLPDPSTLSPAESWAYQQSFYAIADHNVANGNIRTASPGLVQQTIIDNGGTTRTTSSNAVDWATRDGWFVDLNPSSASPGERVNLDPQLDLGTIVVVTNVPNNSACTIGGDSWIYQFDYQAGTYIASASGSVVAQKFTGQTLVGVVVVRLPSGVLKAIATGASGTKTSVGVHVGGAGGSGKRVSWRELLQ